MFAATPSLVARCHDRALRVVQDKLKAGRLVPTLSSPAQPLVVGLGHSMGGLITVVQQGLLRSFDALVVLGHSGSGLPEVLTEAELSLCVEEADLLAVEEQIVELARTRFVEPSEVPRKRPVRGEFFADDVPKAVQGAFAHHATPLMFTCGLAAMIPNLADAQLARIDVPVFLGFGDQDLADNRFDAVSRYRNVTDATLFLLQQSGHCHNQASGRARLWERILRWIENVNAGRWSDLDRPNVPQTSR
jgi:pimeloyl-ACP methyl ester carboxylesterase